MSRTFQEYKESALRDGAKNLGTVNNKTALEAKSTGTQAMADIISHEMKSSGRLESEYDIQKNMEQKAAFYERKANEIMHTTNTGFGAELIPGNILMTDFIDMIPAVSPIMNFFQTGFHGKNMDKKMDVPVLGELPLHQLKAEQTTGALAIAQGTGKLPTKLVTIEQKQRFFSVDISEYEQQFAITDVIALIKRKLAVSSANTIVSDVINGDTSVTSNTNINFIDGGVPASTNSYLAADGLRKQAFTDSTAFDAGTFAFADYLNAIKLLGFNGTNKQDLIAIHSLGAEVAALGIDEFRQAYVNGQMSTALTGKLPSFLGMNISTERWLGEANTAGKISTTASNNVKGQALITHKTAVQWGTNGEYYMEIFRVPGSGYQVIGWYFEGHVIAGSTQVGAPTCSLIYNIS